MTGLHDNSRETAQQFLGASAEIEKSLGAGTDGTVYLTTRPSAIKVFKNQHLFQNELAAYQRIEEREIRNVCGHAVPSLITHDDTLLVLEITKVVPPYILDFGKIELDHTTFSPNQINEYLESCRDKFNTEEQWEQALNIHYVLRKHHGIYYNDLKLGNIEFADNATLD